MTRRHLLRAAEAPLCDRPTPPARKRQAIERTEPPLRHPLRRPLAMASVPSEASLSATGSPSPSPPTGAAPIVATRATATSTSFTAS